MEGLGKALMEINSNQSLNQSPTIQTSNEISIYTGELTKAGLVRITEMLEMAFPKMPALTHQILKERFKANEFSDERAIDAVGYVIDTYEGWDKLPNIANFIQYDKKIKIYTYDELMSSTNSYSPETRKAYFDNYVTIDVGIDKPRWILKEDQQKYNFKLWSKR